MVFPNRSPWTPLFRRGPGWCQATATRIVRVLWIKRWSRSDTDEKAQARNEFAREKVPGLIGIEITPIGPRSRGRLTTDQWIAETRYSFGLVVEGLVDSPRAFAIRARLHGRAATRRGGEPVPARWRCSRHPDGLPRCALWWSPTRSPKPRWPSAAAPAGDPPELRGPGGDGTMWSCRPVRAPLRGTVS